MTNFPNPAHEIKEELLNCADEKQAELLSGFFKTGKGEYGDGDRFLGIKVPVTRAKVKKHSKQFTQPSEVELLISSPWHEIRLAGLLILLELYNRNYKNSAKQEDIVRFYLSHLDCGNNWDLVDLICPGILGDYLLHHPDKRNLLFELAAMDNSLWHQRVAIVATLPLIKKQQFDCTFDIAKKYLDHNHDLIHKATGWMLREVGKNGGMNLLLNFLDEYASRMPRTMLRYAIEKFPEEQRLQYLSIKRTDN